MTTIHIPLQANPLDLNQDGRVTLDELVTSAFWIVKWIMLGMNALNVAILGTFYILSPWEEWTGAVRWSIVILFASVGIGMLAGACVGISRMRRYERAEAEARVDLAHERKRKQFELDQVMGVSRKEDETAWTQATQDRYARLFLEFSIEKGAFVTRDEWKARGLAEDAWNRVNALMQKYHIRKGKSSQLQHETLAEAWGAWCEKTMQSRSWVKSGDDFLKN